MKKAGSRILIITFGIMAAIAILYPWKFVPEYGILQMTESGEKAGKTAESQESDEEYMLSLIYIFQEQNLHYTYYAI